jgi:hypothetical protein
MPTRKAGEEARRTKGSKANLGQKKAEREKAAERQLRHMGANEKAKAPQQQTKK